MNRIRYKFLLCTTALILITTLFYRLVLFVSEDSTFQWAQRYNLFQGISLCSTAATSVLATFIISAEIYRSTSQNINARQQYRHIIEIAIQSSALYTLAALVNAVVSILNNGHLNLLGSTILNVESYADVLAIITTVSSTHISVYDHLIISLFF